MFVINPFQLSAGGGGGNPFPVINGDLWARYKADEEVGLVDGDPLTQATDLSGNGYDIPVVGGSPTWESPIINGHAVYEGDGIADYLQAAFGVSLAGGNYMFGIVRKWSSAFAAQQVLVDSSAQFGAAYYRTSSNTGNAFFNGGSPIGPAASGATDTFAYIECRVNGGSSTIKVNGNIVASGTLLTTTVLGLTFFADGSSLQKSDGQLAEVFLIDSPTGGDEANCETYAMTEYGFAPPPGATANIVCAGDSNTAGTLTFAESYPAQLQDLLNTSYPFAYVVNTGVGGWTWLNLIANEANFIALKASGIPNIMVVQCGLNDYDGGASIVDITTRMEDFMADMSPEYDEIILLTVMPSNTLNGTDFEDLADSYMAASLPANVTKIDQRTAAPTIGADGAQLTSTFQADNKHLSASGNLVEAETAETAILAL